MYVAATCCRLCGCSDLVQVLDLGRQALTGVFPAQLDEDTLEGPLTLAWCRECHLVQLGCDYPTDLMYGDNYGYRSGLNASMVRHLGGMAAKLERQQQLHQGDVVLDIGSNDGTLLAQYATRGLTKIGIDPTAEKFKEFYQPDVSIVSDFFSKEAFFTVSDRPASVVTSVSMFYDLPDPSSFAAQVAECLAEDGVWLLEQSYLPSMLRTSSYDTICHEHLEYYTLETLGAILKNAGLEIMDVRFNRVNGGSFAVEAAHASRAVSQDRNLIEWFISQECRMGFDTPLPFRDFENRVFQHRADLRELIAALKHSGKRVFGLGASTKGNVLLQFCGFTSNDIQCIADVNTYKHGRFTPGTNIPIVSEEQARSHNPDYFLVLPWHFRESIVEREQDFLRRGGGLIFPLPEIEIVQG